MIQEHNRTDAWASTPGPATSLVMAAIVVLVLPVAAAVVLIERIAAASAAVRSRLHQRD